MKKRFYIILAVLLSFLFVFSLVGCSEDEPCEGIVVKKEFLQEHTDVRFQATVIYNGSSCTTMLIPYTYHYPDRWKVTVRWYENEEKHEREIYVTKECYETVKLGDWFVYDTEFCSYKEPCEINRGD